MSAFYEMVGRIVVGRAVKRYERHLKVAAAVGVAIAAIAAAGAVAAALDDDE